jgi:uncharacterized glyoxalase superfamily protein PhnB
MAASSFRTILVYDDIAAAHTFLVDTFGFQAGRLDRSADGETVHGEVEIGNETVWLHRSAPEHGLTSVPALGAASGMLNVFVDDVDTHHERTRAAGARISSPPTDMPYGQREYSAFDCEGQLWSFAAPL